MSAFLQRKQTERSSLALRIFSTGIEMAPCSFCRRHNKRCVAFDQKDPSGSSSRCAECVLHRRSHCDFTSKLPSVQDWESIDRQRQKLRAEEEEAMAKILRLRKQQRFLDEREQEMIRRGLSTLEELEQAEASDRAQAATLEASVQALNEAQLLLQSPSLDPEALTGLPESFWDNLGFPGTASLTETFPSAPLIDPGVSSGISPTSPNS